MRALLLYATYAIDLSEVLPGEQDRIRHDLRAQLLTPICKAYGSDMGFRAIEMAVQVFGGYGVCREYPVEMYLRDSKIASIYEGTNGIQALDLLSRKIGMKKGQVFGEMMQEISDFVEENRSNPELGPALQELAAAKNKLSEVAVHLGGRSMGGDPIYPLLNAYPFLMMFGDVMIAYMLLWQARIAEGKLRSQYQQNEAREETARRKILETQPDAAFYAGKIAAAKFFAFNLLPEVDAKHKALLAGDRSALSLPEISF